MISSTLSPDIRSFFEAALREYEKRAGINLIENELSSKLKGCNTPADVIAVLEEQAQAFREYRGDPERKMMRRLKKAVNVLYTVSTSAVLVEGIGVVSWSYSFTAMRQSFLCSRSRLQKLFSRESVSSSRYVSPCQFPEQFHSCNH